METQSSSATVEQTNTTLIAGLREVADWLEQHPDLPEMPGFYAFVSTTVYGKTARERMEEFARQLGDRAQEGVEHGRVRITGAFDGGVELQMAATVRDLDGEEIKHLQYEPIIPARSEAA